MRRAAETPEAERNPSGPPLARPPRIGVGALLALALPSAAFTVLTNGYRIVDQYFVQGVSVAAQAAVSASVFVLILFYAAFELVAAGAGPLIARATGAGDLERRRRLLGQSLSAVLVLSALLVAIGVAAAPAIAVALGLSGAPAAECSRYLTALFATILPLALTPLIDQTFLAMGNARAPLVLHALSLALNVALTPLLVYEARLGVVGAALASNAARGVASALGVWQLRRELGLRSAHLCAHGELRRILRIGAPMALGTALFAGVYWGLLKTTVSPLGAHVNAALGIGFSALEGFTWPLFHGIALASASLVGRALGAQRPDLAQRVLRTALPVSTVLGIAATAAFYFGAVPLTGLFTDDDLVHRAAAEYAVILAASQLFLAWESLGEGVLAGAGATRVVFWCSAPLNLLRIPLAWVLAFPLGWGPAGVWWAINLTTYGKAALKGWMAWRGRWLKMEP